MALDLFDQATDAGAGGEDQGFDVAGEDSIGEIDGGRVPRRRYFAQRWRNQRRAALSDDQLGQFRSTAAFEGGHAKAGEGGKFLRHVSIIVGGLRKAVAGMRRHSIMENVLGIGGFFFRAKNPSALSQWYSEHLGVAQTPSTYDEITMAASGGSDGLRAIPSRHNLFRQG